MAELAERQHGVVARAQLLAMGMGPRAVDHRLARGRLHLVHRGVYAVGHRLLSAEARWMAAVLVGGPGAALSHRPAATRLALRPSTVEIPEVTVPRALRPRSGIRMHRGRLPPSLRVQDRWFECDFVWRRRRLIVELDGRAFHSTPADFERDRARDRKLHAAGWCVVRVTWRQLHDDPDALASDLRRLLGVGG
jgi:hypothetical protein